MRPVKFNMWERLQEWRGRRKDNRGREDHVDAKEIYQERGGSTGGELTNEAPHTTSTRSDKTAGKVAPSRVSHSSHAAPSHCLTAPQSAPSGPPIPSQTAAASSHPPSSVIVFWLITTSDMFGKLCLYPSHMWVAWIFLMSRPSPVASPGMRAGGGGGGFEDTSAYLWTIPAAAIISSLATGTLLIGMSRSAQPTFRIVSALAFAPPPLVIVKSLGLQLGSFGSPLVGIIFVLIGVTIEAIQETMRGVVKVQLMDSRWRMVTHTSWALFFTGLFEAASPFTAASLSCWTAKWWSVPLRSLNNSFDRLVPSSTMTPSSSSAAAAASLDDLFDRGRRVPWQRMASLSTCGSNGLHPPFLPLSSQSDPYRLALAVFNASLLPAVISTIIAYCAWRGVYAWSKQIPIRPSFSLHRLWEKMTKLLTRLSSSSSPTSASSASSGNKASSKVDNKKD